MTPDQLGRRSYLKLSAAVLPTGLLAGLAVGGGDPDGHAVETKPAVDVGETSATLRGVVTDFGDASAIDVHVEWRALDDDDDGWNASESITVTTGKPFEIEVDGLARATVYEFRVVGVAGGHAEGKVRTFVTRAKKGHGKEKYEDKREHLEDKLEVVREAVTLEKLSCEEHDDGATLKAVVTNETEYDLSFSWSASDCDAGGEIAVDAGESVCITVAHVESSSTLTLYFDGTEIASIDADEVPSCDDLPIDDD